MSCARAAAAGSDISRSRRSVERRRRAHRNDAFGEFGIGELVVAAAAGEQHAEARAHGLGGRVLAAVQKLLREVERRGIVMLGFGQQRVEHDLEHARRERFGLDEANGEDFEHVRAHYGFAVVGLEVLRAHVGENALDELAHLFLRVGHALLVEVAQHEHGPAGREDCARGESARA